MTHDVVWSQEAFQSLQKIWDEAYDRELVAHAVDEIQAALQEDAHEVGESRPDGSRIHFEFPLAIAFWANDRTTEVQIRAVWSFQ